jgi:hypothetical protein
MSLLFYTTASGKYESFIPLYIYFALRNNPDSRVEIGVSDRDKYVSENNKIINVLRNKFGEKFRLQEISFNAFSPSAARFVIEPSMIDECDYVYIGDIDILILDNNVKDIHIQNMRDASAPFSNIIRSPEATQGNYYRLSGLHFAPISTQYPLPDTQDLTHINKGNVRGFDEHILYRIMKKKKIR